MFDGRQSRKNYETEKQTRNGNTIQKWALPKFIKNQIRKLKKKTKRLMSEGTWTEN